MKRLLAALGYLLIFSTRLVAQEPGTALLRCPQRAINVKLFSKAIQAQILSQIDTSIYEDPTVKVKLTIASRPRSNRSNDLEEILDGLILEQQGISFSANGALQFSDPCDFTYLMRIKVTATDAATGQPVQSITDSVVTITSDGEMHGVVTPPSSSSSSSSGSSSSSSEEEEEEE